MKKNKILYLFAFLIGFIPNFITYNNTILGFELAILLIFFTWIYGYQAMSKEFLSNEVMIPKMMKCFLITLLGIILGEYFGEPTNKFLPLTMFIASMVGTFIGACIGYLSEFMAFIYISIYKYIKEK